ncbi:MAG: hypothetical protein AAFR53_05000 [Pseudomonadota bacterium]
MARRDDVTLCVTMGLRPDELRDTVESMGPELRSYPILAVNDFGDEETNDVFRTLIPHGRIIDMNGKKGHMNALRALYAGVETNYVMHFEDDWEFVRTDFLDESIAILDEARRVSQVCLRADYDIKFARHAGDDLPCETLAGVETFRLDRLHDVWFRFTLNPHVARTRDWQWIIRRNFRDERHISRKMRGNQRYTAFLKDAVCHHAGRQLSVRKQLHPNAQHLKVVA